MRTHGARLMLQRLVVVLLTLGLCAWSFADGAAWWVIVFVNPVAAVGTVRFVMDRWVDEGERRP